MFSGWNAVEVDENGEALPNGSSEALHLPQSISIPYPDAEASDAEKAAYHDRYFRVEAQFEEGYQVIFYAEDFGNDAEKKASTPVLVTVVEKKGRSIIVDSWEVENAEGRTFIGWKKAGASDDKLVTRISNRYVDADGHEKEDDIVELVPVMKENHTVTLDANGGGFRVWNSNHNVQKWENSETKRQLTVAPGATIAEPKDGAPDAPVRTGYVLQGWYTDDAFLKEFDFRTPVTKDMTLYAKWVPVEVTYTVRVWQENADDDDYTLAETEQRQGPADADVEIRALLKDFTKDKYTGFHLNGTGANSTDPRFKDDREAIIFGKDADGAAYAFDATKKRDGDITIAPGGSTIVNIYYSRDTYLMTFRFAERIGDPGYRSDINGDPGYTKLMDGITGAWKNGTTYTDVEGTQTPIKYRQSLYQGIYVNGNNAEKIRAFMDDEREQGWFFGKAWEGNGSKDHQIVFNAGDPDAYFDPKGAADGADVLCLIQQKSGMEEYSWISHYMGSIGLPKGCERGEGDEEYGDCYDVDGDGTKEEFEYWKEYWASYVSPYKREFTIGAVVNGYELIAVTGDDAGERKTVATNVDGDPNKTTYQYTFKLDADGDPEPLHLYWVPAKYTITFVQGTPGSGAFHPDDTLPPVTLTYTYGDSLRSRGIREERDGVLDKRDAATAGGRADAWSNARDAYGVVHSANGYYEGGLPDTMPRENLTFTVRWVADNCTVYYDLNRGADGKSNKELTFTTVSSYGLAPSYEEHRKNMGSPELTRPGYTFLYWEAHRTGTRAGDWSCGDLLTDSTFQISKENDAKGAANDEEKTDREIVLVAQYEKQESRMTHLTYHANYPDGKDDAIKLEGHVVNGTFVVRNINDPIIGFPNEYKDSNGNQYRFECWTTEPTIPEKQEVSTGNHKKGKKSKRYSGKSYETFYPGDRAAAGATDNDLYALWIMNVEKPPTDPTEPTKPTDPTEPTVVVREDPEEPTLPTPSVEPEDPTEPEEPAVEEPTEEEPTVEVREDPEEPEEPTVEVRENPEDPEDPTSPGEDPGSDEKKRDNRTGSASNQSNHASGSAAATGDSAHVLLTTLLGLAAMLVAWGILFLRRRENRS